MPTLQNSFPALDGYNHQLTSPSTEDYNCIAWAAEQDDEWWWPIPEGAGYWPDGITRAESVEAFTSAFATLGYLPCATAELEAGHLKVAIYAFPNGTVTHMARQLPDGQWTSKLGPWKDISHATLAVIEGPEYGQPVAFLRK